MSAMRDWENYVCFKKTLLKCGGQKCLVVVNGVSMPQFYLSCRLHKLYRGFDESDTWTLAKTKKKKPNSLVCCFPPVLLMGSLCVPLSMRWSYEAYSCSFKTTKQPAGRTERVKEFATKGGGLSCIPKIYKGEGENGPPEGSPLISLSVPWYAYMCACTHAYKHTQINKYMRRKEKKI